MACSTSTFMNGPFRVGGAVCYEIQSQFDARSISPTRLVGQEKAANPAVCTTPGRLLHTLKACTSESTLLSMLKSASAMTIVVGLCMAGCTRSIPKTASSPVGVPRVGWVIMIGYRHNHGRD